jgi:hypothetical protein
MAKKKCNLKQSKEFSRKWRQKQRAAEAKHRRITEARWQAAVRRATTMREVFRLYGLSNAQTIKEFGPKAQ